MESLPGSVEAPAWQKAINWEIAGAFRVRWLVVCETRFHRVGAYFYFLFDVVRIELRDIVSCGCVAFVPPKLQLGTGTFPRA